MGGSRVRVERYLPLHDTVLKRYRVAEGGLGDDTAPEASWDDEAWNEPDA